MLVVVLLFAACPPATAQQSFAAPDDWAQRDLEGKWIAYRRAVADQPAAVHERWHRWLREAEEFALLEWIAIYEPRRGSQTASPLAMLVAADAPQWLRVAVWLLPNHADSHQKDEAERVLLEHAAVALAWLERHGLDDESRFERLLPALEAGAADRRRRDVSAYLPPLEPEPIVLAWLDAPPDLPEFGDRQRAERGVRYVHQVLRGIDGVVHGRLHRQPYLGKLTSLATHTDGPVRRRAILALGELPAVLVPWPRLQQIVDTAAEPADRALAAWSLSNSDHPAAMLHLLDVAADTEHPARATAIERLGDRAGPYELEFLVRESARRPDSDLTAAIAIARRQLAALEKAPPDATARVLGWLSRAGWARVVGRGDADSMRAALQRSAAPGGPLATDAARKVLNHFADHPPVRWSHSDVQRQAALTAAVVELVNELRR